MDTTAATTISTTPSIIQATKNKRRSSMTFKSKRGFNFKMKKRSIIKLLKDEGRTKMRRIHDDDELLSAFYYQMKPP